GEKGLQAGKTRLLMIEREPEKLVEHVADLMAETGEIGPAAAIRAEQGRVEIMRGLMRGSRLPALEPVDRAREKRVGFGELPQAPPDRHSLRPLRRHFKKIILAQIQQRALEQGGKRKIVIGEKHETAECDEILDRNMVGQAQAVGAC